MSGAGAVSTEGKGARSRRHCTSILRQPKRAGLPPPVAVRTGGLFPRHPGTGDDVISPQIWGLRRPTSREEWGGGQYIGLSVNGKTRTLATPPILAPGSDQYGPGRGRRLPYGERRPPGRRKTLNLGTWGSWRGKGNPPRPPRGVPPCCGEGAPHATLAWGLRAHQG